MAAGVVILGACAVQPTARAPVTTPMALAAAPAADAADSGYGAFVRSARAQGYRPITTGGKEQWCRETTSLDSRVSRRSCISAPAVDDVPGPADESSDPPRTGQ